MTDKIYFASDVHLGAQAIADPLAHERRFVKWLDLVKKDATALYLMGDIFDFWYEYKYVVPRGHVRTLGKLIELVEQGVEVHFFTGNHDIWTFGYLEHEIGMKIHKEPLIVELIHQKFFLAHGDGLGDPSKSFCLLQKIFHNSFAQKLFSFLVHPNLAFGFGNWWSGKSRKSSDQEQYSAYMGEDKEHLVKFSKNYLEKDSSICFFVYGHRHIPLDLELKETARVIILGDWIHNFTYGVWDGKHFLLETFEG